MFTVQLMYFARREGGEKKDRGSKGAMEGTMIIGWEFSAHSQHHSGEEPAPTEFTFPVVRVFHLHSNVTLAFFSYNTSGSSQMSFMFAAE